MAVHPKEAAKDAAYRVSGVRERDGSLWNHDLAPTSDDQRTWTALHFAALWVGMAVCIPTYTLASSLIDQGMSWKQALICVAIGNVVVLLPMILNAHPGTRYGIPFPVLARASFGVVGANVPAVLRALVACGWFGIQTWLGGKALFQLFVAVFPSMGPPLTSASMKAAVGIHPGEALGFALFWGVNVWFILKGTESIKWLETWAAPFLLVVGLALLGWAYRRANGFGPMLSRPSALSGADLFRKMTLGVTAMVGFWATLSLNIPDFSRYARSQRDQAVGQAIGLPGTMVLFSFIGVAVTSATPVIFGETIWDPVQLLGRVGGPLTMFLAMLGLSVATLSTNLAANVVSPANDFANLAPSKISYRMGGVITAVAGVLILPWKLIESSKGYIYTWLVGYSALLGPIGGIMIADYFIVRRKRLEVDDLYRRGGAYEHSGGVNWNAMFALALGVALNFPGFLAEAWPKIAPSIPQVFKTLYQFAWFVGFLVAGGAYVLGTRAFARDRDG